MELENASEIERQEMIEEPHIEDLSEYIAEARALSLIENPISQNDFLSFDDQIMVHEPHMNPDSLVEEIYHQFKVEQGLIEEEDDDEGEILQDKDEEEEQENENELYCPSYQEVQTIFEHLKVFAATNEPTLFEDVLKIQNKFSEMRRLKVRKTTQTKLDLFFLKV